MWKFLAFFFFCLIFTIYTILLFKLAQKQLYDMPLTRTEGFSFIGFSKKIIFNCTICLTMELNCPWESNLNVCFWVQNKHVWRKYIKHINYSYMIRDLMLLFSNSILKCFTNITDLPIFSQTHWIVWYLFVSCCEVQWETVVLKEIKYFPASIFWSSDRLLTGFS